MHNVKKYVWTWLMALPVCAALAMAQSPSILFTDLESGPNAGGENNNGAFVTIYGTNLGAAPTVTVGGGAAIVKQAPQPYLWYQKMSIQLGASARTGSIVVTNPSGASNSVPFTVRAGNIKCVSPTGSNSNSGNFGSCWATLPYAVEHMAAGDIAYGMDGVQTSGNHLYSAALFLVGGGTVGNPKALAAYPGAKVTIAGVLNSPATSGTQNTFGLKARSDTSTASGSNWVISGLVLTGYQHMIGGIQNVRIIGNDITCPYGNVGGGSACPETAALTNLDLLGNYIHDIGTGFAPGGVTKLYHGVYFTTNTNSVDAGWNEIARVNGCRGMQFHSTSGNSQFDLHVHDNKIHDTVCDGLNFATVDPSKGVVEAYNNVIYRTGTGPDPTDGGSIYSCIYSADITNAGTPGSGSIEIYNNTLYNCGSRGTANGAIVKSGSNSNLRMHLRNNIVQQLSGEPYLNFSNGLSQFWGDTNLFYGNGSAPTQTTNNLNVDPQFVSASAADFHLKSTSPAKDAGLTVAGLGADIDGINRPQGSGYDLGASEYASTTPPPAAPTNLTVVVQ
jgi:hypothetical protein